MNEPIFTAEDVAAMLAEERAAVGRYVRMHCASRDALAIDIARGFHRMSTRDASFERTSVVAVKCHGLKLPNGERCGD